MDKKILIGIIVVALAAGFLGFMLLRKPAAPATPATTQDTMESNLPEADSSISVSVKRHPTKDNTIVLTINGLGGKYVTVAYEISYESKGIVQGVTTKPLDITGKDTFVRDDIYLGTCSKNVCTPHTGVSKVSVVLEFTDADGGKSQLSKDFDI